MYLVKKHRSRAECIGKPPAILNHGQHIVADVASQIQAFIRSLRHAAIACAADSTHVRRRWPTGGEIRAQASLSGQLEGCAFWKAGNAIQASNTAMVRVRPE